MKKQSVETIEHRLRETLKRRGFILVKSRRRDLHALTYGRYWIIKERPPMAWQSFLISATEGDADRAYTMTLDQVDAWCESGKSGHPGFSSIPMMACEFAMEAYITERQETAPEKETEAKATKRPRGVRASR